MARVRKATQEAVSTIWNIALYIRLSREDWKGDDKTDVSRSITEQKKMLEEYVETHFQADYTVVDIYIDDGLTGTDDMRDNFQRMMEDVETGKVNCIIVKTLSRAFRNYADQGRYLEQIFPRKGIRFIAISNPFVDSFKDPDAIQNGMEIPINGLMNDRYAAKTSADIRRTFDAKRQRGEFIGAFAPYGYQKDPENRNRLLVDTEAAQIVKKIFLWFVSKGMSKTAIAKKLNELGIPNPSTYKTRIQQLKYRNPYALRSDGFWCGSMILYILTNEVYIGNMVQGRSRIISYKVHMQVRVPKTGWYIVPDTHEAIIDRETFNKAQALHRRDTRTAPAKRELYLFSGFLRCADCRKAMRRKTAKNLTYYSCRTQTDKGLCSKHTIREDKLMQAVLVAIRMQISLTGSLTDIANAIKGSPGDKTGADGLNSMLKSREEELHKILAAIDSLYLDWKDGIITKADYLRMKDRFDEKCSRIRDSMEAIKEEYHATVKSADSGDTYLTAFINHQNITVLERSIVVELIDMIYVHKGGQITIHFTFADQLLCI